MQQQIIRQNVQSAGSTSTGKKGFLQTFNIFSSPMTGSSGSSKNPITAISNLMADTLSPERRRNITGTAAGTPAFEEHSRQMNYNDRESALAETLEIAQERIMQLVSEMESNQEAQTIVLETKEAVLRSLARQNTHLAMEVCVCSNDILYILLF
jgi:hypothetical protein